MYNLGMDIKRPLFIAAAALFLPLSGFSADYVIVRSTYYLTARQQELADFPAPPAAGSEADRADMATLKDWQGKRTAYGEFFGDISPFPAPMPAPAAEVFRRVKAQTDAVAAQLKERFRRPRPFARDAALEPCLGRVGGLAYPSGHATISRLFALILADLVPSRKKEFLARADEAALYRVIGGVHYPSDIEAGRKLAEKVYRAYEKSPAFRADIKILKGQLAEAAVPR